MSTMNAAQLEPTMYEVVEDVLNKHFEENTQVTKRVGDGGPINTRGRRVPIYALPNASFNWFAEAGAYATPLQTTDVETKVYPVRCSAGFEFSGTYFRQASSSEVILKGITNYMSRTQTSALKKFEQAFCATYTGELAVVVSRDGNTQFTASTTYANGSLFGARKLPIGGKVNFYSSAGAQRTTTTNHAYISNVTLPVQSTGVVTTMTTNIPDDVVATDIVVFGDSTTAGSYAKAVNGLQDFVASSGVIQTQDRATWPQLKSYVADAGGAAISQVQLRKLTSSMIYRSEAKSINFTMLSAPCQHDMYERQLLNLIRYTPGGEGKQELKPAFGQFEWMISPDIHDDRVYFLDFSAFKWHPLKKWGRYNEDGMDWRLYFSNGAASDKFTGLTQNQPLESVTTLENPAHNDEALPLAA